MDPGSKIARLYKLSFAPTTFFIDSEGVVQDIQQGIIKLDWIKNNLSKGA
jgi:hypothetical protein